MTLKVISISMFHFLTTSLEDYDDLDLDDFLLLLFFDELLLPLELTVCVRIFFYFLPDLVVLAPSILSFVCGIETDFLCPRAEI